MLKNVWRNKKHAGKKERLAASSNNDDENNNIYNNNNTSTILHRSLQTTPANNTLSQEPQSSSQSIPTMNSFSEAGFLLNSSFTLSIGYYGIFGTKTLPYILQQYPNLFLIQANNNHHSYGTLVIWCIIYLSQFIYIMIQSYRPYESPLVSSGVGYCYFWASVFQMGWIIFTSLDLIWCAVTCLAFCVIFSTTIVIRQFWYLFWKRRQILQWELQRLRRENKKSPPSFFDNHNNDTNDDNDDDDDTTLDAPAYYGVEEFSAGVFWIVQFPFASYCGLLWTFLATFVQVVFVRYYPDVISANVEYYVMLGFIIFLGVFGLVLLLLLETTTACVILPVVWGWYLIGVYWELQSPSNAILQRFPQSTITLVQWETLGIGATLLFFSIAGCALCSRTSRSLRRDGIGDDTNDEDDEDTAKSSNESTTSYVRQEDIENKGSSADGDSSGNSSASESLSRPYRI
mmetsp:Transcript_5024/g.7885  ORF Transcript_5024/g.7885 Transcript_5024/m.7885 type:complete len:458 (+) Transcript_5024:169-1542(+)|eukprot:CAMPEP_0194236646 /NCGR_PEP_ID=MMETSP0158-20130606/3851_1 /TAXON_ID=33649 /ORGANISM="Thalassionema nitzschioides, Strain L26-B" /LENGTH=457 /DNA_ID=CAMNT_0038970461 /DNA_START=132 /DNA_END=1505 /DNA_ORIENTATION=+